jgi:hypothetical protein
MSERLKAKLGDELYNQIIAKGIKENEFDLVEGWIPKTRFDEVSKELKITKSKVSSLEEQSSKQGDLVKDNETLKNDFANLKTQYTTDLQNKDKEITNIYKTTKVQNALIKEGSKHPELLMGQIELDKLTLDGENVVGLTDVVTNLKTKYPDYFIVKQTNTTNQTQGSKESDQKSNDTNWDEVLKTF